jgi:2-dehydro-3-deoxyphosphooctonate aldolase (KDO 8-P synthase)
MHRVVEKARATGNAQLLVTERGFAFGYNNLVSDMRALPILAATGCPVVYDATHSAQRPGAQGNASGGDREFIAPLARAAVAAGADAIFMEVHEEPSRALSDGATSLALADVPRLWRQLVAIATALREPA